MQTDIKVFDGKTIICSDIESVHGIYFYHDEKKLNIAAPVASLSEHDARKFAVLLLIAADELERFRKEN